MALLRNLQLQGIRSFGHESSNAQVIEFTTPVTLFLGQNGSGKTTIIEALKYACSGELPPNSDSGKCFVHDPKISMLSEVKGHIKLRFTDSRGREITIVKVMQVMQQRNGKSTFSSLDHAIKIVDLDGTVTELSSRCADMKNVIFQYFGVSKPIINNVIFCQQDNALWPLDDGKKLKEKFDAIFNIDSYNTAIEKYRIIIKKKKEEQKNKNENLKYAKELKDEVVRKQSILSDKKKEISVLENEMSEKNKTLSKVHDRIKEITTIEDQLSEIKAKLASKETAKDSVKKQQETLSDSITEKFTGSDKELNTEIESFEGKCEQDRNNLQKYKDNLKELDNKENHINSVTKQLQVTLGTLKEKHKQQESKISKQNSLISNLSHELGVEHYDFNKGTIELLETNLQKYKADMNEVQRKQKLEEKSIQNVIDKTREKREVTLHDISLKKKDIKETQEKFCEISSKLHDLSVSDEQMFNYKQKLTKIEKELDSLNKMSHSESITNKLKLNKGKINELERNQEDFEKDKKLLQKNCITENEIESKNLLLRKREADINKLKDKHHHALRMIFKTVPTSNFKYAIQNRALEIENEIKSVRNELDNKQKSVTRLEIEKNLNDEKHKALKEKLVNIKGTIRKACRGKPYEEYVKELHLDMERLQTERGEYKSVEIMYKKYMKHLQDEKCCPVCDTGFHDKKDTIDKLIRNMAMKIKRLPEDIKNIEEQLRLKQNEHSQLLQLNSINEEIKEIDTQLPEIKKKIDDIEAELETANDSLNDQDENLTSSNVDLKMCNDVMGDFAVIDQYQEELKTLKTETVNLELQLITLPSNMTLRQIEEKLEDIKEELSNTRKDCDSLQKKINQNNERRNDLIQERNNIVEKQLNLQKNVQGRPLLEDQKIELQKKEETLKEMMQSLKDEEFNLTKLLAEEKDKLEVLREANEKVYEKHNTKYTKCEKVYDELFKLQAEIQRYVNDKSEELYEKTKSDLCNLITQEEKNKQSKTEMAQKINDITRTMDSESNKFRSLKDNLRLRDLWKEEKIINNAIIKLLEQLKDYNHKSIQEERLTLSKRYMVIEKEIVYNEGHLNEIKKNVKDLELDLDRPNNQNAYKNFKKKLFEVQVTNIFMQDIDMYTRSLENAVIMYHASRMKHINMIIKDLWQSIYKGNDIDYVQIKAKESENKSAVRRVYNYKVVQYRNNVELDMSGRCSAGQKVLACLLIRMALAETFSHNCGILALDEPTTNLDKDNIKSLGDAIANIINNRQQQKNFQLLIITHDTYFLDTLRTLGCAEYYYKVSRNVNGASLVTQLPF